MNVERKWWAIGLGLLVVLVVSSTALAGSADSGSRFQRTFVCVNKHNGLMKVISRRQHNQCAKGWKRYRVSDLFGNGSEGGPSVPGSAGKQGPAGPAGAKGDTGQKGDPGAPGAAGTQGAQGAQGSKGDTGPSGAQGPQGPAGPAGKDGLGNEVDTLCINKEGGSIKYENGKNECDPGHETTVHIVVVTDK